MEAKKIIEVRDLVYKDRFYFAAHGKKEVWEVVSQLPETRNFKGFLRQGREVKNDAGVKKFTVFNTKVVFLRNELVDAIKKASIENKTSF